jgi:hypothetical protein
MRASLGAAFAHFAEKPAGTSSRATVSQIVTSGGISGEGLLDLVSAHDKSGHFR